ncbi:MAG: hypothetical protein DWQ04_17410 [Chloroflexi bacterium]|nr:MAG: hypothetical protein DWQ04_17410 [Chloroflexota bacterium]
MKSNEKRLFLENTLSQQLIMFYIVGNAAFTIFYVNSSDINYRLGTFIMLNIVLSLFAFLMAVRQKVYQATWGYIGIGIAVFQFARLFWIPEEIVNPVRLLLVLLLAVTAVSALTGSIICVKRSRERQNYIIDNNIDMASLQK